ncbi:hypothetical protein [Vulcanisaeta sp. JCM 16161]|uniref:hypothetical protein n=1 Tax=Vulcanisaeta sp. JCM 16161 TaxID=1295372 RepID=UPI00406C2FBF
MSVEAHDWIYFYGSLWLLVMPGVGTLIYAYRGYRSAERRREYVELHNAIWGFNNALVTPSKSFRSGEAIYTIIMAIITFVILGAIATDIMHGRFMLSDIVILLILIGLYMPYYLIIRRTRRTLQARRNEIRDILLYSDYMHITTATNESLDIPLSEAIICIAELNIPDMINGMTSYDVFKIKYNDRVLKLTLPHGAGSEFINVLKDKLGLEIHTCNYLGI